MTELKKIKDMVATILEQMPATRSNDRLLVSTVYRLYYGVTPEDTFFQIMRRVDLPSQESITRARRKLQETMPLVYGANGKTRKLRAELEEEYRKEYAKNQLLKSLTDDTI